MNQITAPYGFVPLSKTVVFPEWVQPHDGTMPPLHDVPFEDGLCGTLELEIEAETPIFIRGTQDKELPFRLEEGAYAVPGTALRGALRNVLEIATFSRFSRVNDHRYAVRDLQNPALYGRYMADIVENLQTGKKEPMPLVNAGWLTRKRNADGEWGGYTIEVCDFAKIEYRGLENVAQQRRIFDFCPGKKQSSVDKYRTWGNAPLEVTVQVDWRRPDHAGSRPLVSGYGVAALREGGQSATIVFTGQPSNWRPDQMGKRAGAGNAKHHDFVFLPQEKTQSLDITPKVFEDFEFGHSDRGQQNALGRSQEPNPEWKFWGQHLEKGRPVPVFFLTDDNGEVKSLGLALMFRLPYKHSVGEAICKVSPDHGARCPRLAGTNGSTKIFDFAEGLFGTVREQGAREERDRNDRSALALKGRVGVSHARATAATRPQGSVLAILGAPKASYYPNYVEQDPGRPGGQPQNGYRPEYKTWNDEDGAPRGWKRYRVLTETWNPRPPSGGDGRTLDLAKVGTKFHPLPSGTRFRAHVDVHNLRPEELGALLWVLDFGKDEKARHMLGMARPLGYGKVRMSIAGSAVIDMKGNPADLAACTTRFVEYMRGHVPNWEKCPQIEELRALAHPVPPSAAFYQRLDPGEHVNEFVEAKKQGLALPSAFPHPSRSSVGSRPTVSSASGGQRPGGGQPNGYRSENGRGQGSFPGARPGGFQGGRPGGYGGRQSASPAVGPVERLKGAPAVTKAVPRPTTDGKPWRDPKRDDIIEVELAEINRKGKWTCTVVGYTGTKGTLGGSAPPDAAAGKHHKATVVVGNDCMNLELRWVTE